jgi:hypothetical protein
MLKAIKKEKAATNLAYGKNIRTRPSQFGQYEVPVMPVGRLRAAASN